MKKEKKFLEELDKKLVGIGNKEKQSILLKYQEMIKSRKDNKERIKDIIKSIGSVDEVAKKEIEEYKKNNSFKYKFNKLFHSIKSFVINDLNKDKEKEEKARQEKKIKQEERKAIREEKRKLRKENRQLKKEEKKKLREEKKKIKAEKKKLFEEEKKKSKDKIACKCCKQRTLDKDSVNEVCSVCGWKSDKSQEDNPNLEGGSNKLSLKQYRKEYRKTKPNKFKEFLNKFKKKKTVTEEIKEEVEEIESEFSEEISKITDIATETRIFETKEERNRRVIINTIKVIVTTILIFLWLWITVVFIASVFGYLDGVKFYGLVIGLFGLDLLVLQIIIFINKSLFNRRINRKWSFILILISVLIIAAGIVLALRQIYKINTTSDVSEKYNMSKKLSSYNLSSDTNKKFYITFNANYNTEYIVEYDNTLNNKINVEVKYYECYYDYFAKKENNNVYISLRLDKRDRLSVYIDDFKEGKIYDNDELSRYAVKITLNERDKDRVVIK